MSYLYHTRETENHSYRSGKNLTGSISARYRFLFFFNDKLLLDAFFFAVWTVSFVSFLCQVFLRKEMLYLIGFVIAASFVYMYVLQFSYGFIIIRSRLFLHIHSLINVLSLTRSQTGFSLIKSLHSDVRLRANSILLTYRGCGTVDVLQVQGLRCIRYSWNIGKGNKLISSFFLFHWFHVVSDDFR